MIVNIISDIHADYDPKSGRVQYHYPFQKAENKYVEAVGQLLSYWKTQSKQLKARSFGRVKSYFEEPFINAYDDALKFLSEFETATKSGFENTPPDGIWRFAQGLSRLDDYFVHYGLDWADGKTRCSMYDVKTYMFKKAGDFDPARLEPADYLIIAGDLGLANTYDLILADMEKQTAGKFKKILHIAGNHDHWWHGINGMNLKRPDDVDFSRDYCEHVDGDYVFLGCTLWTPISDGAVWRVGKYMNDYRFAPNFTPYRSREQYRIQSEWLKNRIAVNKGRKIVVFTHHQPFEELILDDYRHNGKNWDGIDVNEAYVVTDHSLDDVNENGDIRLWCCGHTHKNFDGILHGTRVVRNPIGYGDMYGKIPAENISGTWYNKIIEV